MMGKRPLLSQSAPIPPLCDTWLSAKKHKKSVNRPAQNMQVKVKHLWWPAIKPAAVTKQASLLEYFLPGAKPASDYDSESTVDNDDNLVSTESHQTTATDDDSSIVDDTDLTTVASQSTAFECEIDGSLQSDDDVDDRCADDRTRCDPSIGGSINADGSTANAAGDSFRSEHVSKPSCGSVIDSANEATCKCNRRPTSSIVSCTCSPSCSRRQRLFSCASDVVARSAEVVLVPDSLQQVADCDNARSLSSQCVPSSFVENSIAASLSTCSSGNSSDADGACSICVDDEPLLKGCSKRWQGRGVSRPESDTCASRKQIESKRTISSACRRRIDSELSRSRAVNSTTEKHETVLFLQSELTEGTLEPIADNSDLSFCKAGESSYDMVLGYCSDLKLTDTQKVSMFEMELELMNERRCNVNSSSQIVINDELALDTCSQFF